jgi:hypothetical protein
MLTSFAVWSRLGLLLTWAAAPNITALSPAGGQVGTEVRVALTGEVDAAQVEFWSSNPGLEWVAADGKDAVKLRISPDAAPGLSWLVFHNAEGASVQRPFVVGRFPELLETEPNNPIDPAAPPLALPVVQNGVLQKNGDVDTYPVTLKQGETLVANVEALRTLGSPMDALVSISDERGFVLWQADDAPGFDPRWGFTAPRDGRYFVRVFAFPAAPDSGIRYSGGATYVYRLTLTTGPVITRWTSQAVTVGVPATLHGHGWNTPSEGLPFEVTAAEPGWLTPRHPDALVLAPVWGTPHPVVVATPENSREQPQTVPFPVVLSGGISTPRAVQAWAFPGVKDQTVRVQLATRAFESPLDGVVQLLGPDGGVLKTWDDDPHGDDELDVTAKLPADGTYRLTIRERFDLAGPDYGYLLTLSTPTPTVELTVPDSVYRVTPAAKLELPVALDRRFGFDQPLQVTIDGLPDGVTADPVTSEPKGDTAKSVKLTVQSTRGEPWLGPLTIVAKTTAEPAVTFTTQVARTERTTMPLRPLLKVAK